MRNPTREIDIEAPARIYAVLDRLDLNREAVLVIVNGALVPGDAVLTESDTVEIRSVISGGAL